MRTIIFLAFFSILLATPAFAQHGGKAEPKRIEFAAGKSSTSLSGTLSNSQEMEYVFAARKGQTVTIRNATRSLFDFRVFSPENFPDGDFDSSASYTFEIPETGDYMFFVRKKQVKTPRTARFSMTLSIK
ncbi:MAG: hypothetical protein QM785_04675 [Pyrinomonadaceae bacterium]